MSLSLIHILCADIIVFKLSIASDPDGTELPSPSCRLRRRCRRSRRRRLLSASSPTVGPSPPNASTMLYAHSNSYRWCTYCRRISVYNVCVLYPRLYLILIYVDDNDPKDDDADDEYNGRPTMFCCLRAHTHAYSSETPQSGWRGGWAFATKRTSIRARALTAEHAMRNLPKN